MDCLFRAGVGGGALVAGRCVWLWDGLGEQARLGLGEDVAAMAYEAFELVADAF